MADEVKLKIDHRETKLARLLTDLAVVEIVQLPIADIVISHNDIPVIAIERKTVSDLCASIKDSRYKEQKERLLNAYDRESIMYIIEGEWTDDLDEMAKGAIINTMLRDKIKVFMTPSISMTAQYITSAYKRIVKNGLSYTKGGGNGHRGEYVDALSQVASIAKKRDLMDNRIFSVLSLSLIPGVSKVIAKAIVEACGYIGDLVASSSNDKQALISSIANIKLESGKRVGKVIAERVATFLGQQKNEHL